MDWGKIIILVVILTALYFFERNLKRIKNKNLKFFLEVLGVLAVVGFMIYLFILSGKLTKDLEEHGCYTIGVTDGFKYAHKQGGLGAYYIYNYKGKEYRDWNTTLEGTKYRGGKYLVKFSIKNPENSTISFSTPIQGDSIPIEYRPLCSEIEKLE